VPEQEPQDRHGRLEGPEHDGHSQAKLGVDARQADPDRRGEVGQAEGCGHQDQAKHAPKLRGPDGS
jgi:hypothetical protein